MRGGWNLKKPLWRALVRRFTPRRLRHRIYILRGMFGRWGLARTIHVALWESWYEYKFGVDTTLIISEHDLDVPEDARKSMLSHWPSWYLVMRESLADGSIDWRDEVFIDYGSGLGRALLFASTLPFRRIIGVELSKMLCEKAQENLQHYYRKAGKTAPEFLVIAADASEFDLPDDVTVIYFFNPFRAELLRVVVGKIEESLQRAPRKCIVIYVNPWFPDEFTSRGFKRLPKKSQDFDIFVAPTNGGVEGAISAGGANTPAGTASRTL
jgi:hypothetical protein